MYIAIGLAIIIVSAMTCHYVAKQRQANPVFWGVMGIIFGPFAIPFAFFAKAKHAV